MYIKQKHLARSFCSVLLDIVISNSDVQVDHSLAGGKAKSVYFVRQHFIFVSVSFSRSQGGPWVTDSVQILSLLPSITVSMS